jgi:HAD superfamily hydrolase (TIGR01459 family)
VIASDADRTLLADIGLVETQDLAAADMLLVVGIDSPRVSVAALETLLAEARAQDLPMVCANADVTRVDPAGLFEGPGAVALRYAAIGGRVHWFGKPHREIFDATFAAIGGRDGRRHVMVGDSISHDVLGARNAGIDAALILAGIHRELLLGVDASTQRANLATLCSRHRATPDFVLETFAWG